MLAHSSGRGSRKARQSQTIHPDLEAMRLIKQIPSWSLPALSTYNEGSTRALANHIRAHFSATALKTIRLQNRVSFQASSLEGLAREALPLVRKQAVDSAKLRKALSSLKAIQTDTLKARVQTERALVAITALRLFLYNIYT